MKQVPEVKEFIVFFLLKLVKDSILLASECQKKYGDICYKHIKGTKTYFIFHPLQAEHFLSKNQDNYRKYPPFVSNFEPFLGKNNLLSSNDPPQWKHDRELCKTAFEAEIYFEKYANQITKNCQLMMDDWRLKYLSNGTACPIAHELDILALKNINDTIFRNIDIDIESLADHVPEIFRLIASKALSITHLPWILPSKRKRQYEEEVKYIQEVKRKALLSRIKSGKNYDDLLGTLISDYKVTGEGCPHFKSVTNQMMTFDIVGYTTTTSAFRWIVTTLVQHPEVEKKIREEVLKICDQRNPTYADFEKLKYTQATVMEVLRFNPPLAVILREVIADDEVMDYPIEGGTALFIISYQIHRHPDYWAEPEKFNPDRFLNKPYGQDFQFAYLPFGGGKRSCIGKNFAFMELCLFTAMLVQRFQITFPKDYQLKRSLIASVFLRPDIDTVFLKESN